MAPGVVVEKHRSSWTVLVQRACGFNTLPCVDRMFRWNALRGEPESDPFQGVTDQRSESTGAECSASTDNLCFSRERTSVRVPGTQLTYGFRCLPMLFEGKVAHLGKVALLTLECRRYGSNRQDAT